MQNGPLSNVPDFKQYSIEEVQRFNEIIDAQNAGDAEKVQRLYNLLPENEEAKFEEYCDDLKEYHEYQESVKEQLAFHQKNIDEAKAKLEAYEILRTVITLSYAQQLSTATSGKPSTQNQTTSAKPVENTKSRKETGGCTLF